MNVKQKFSYCRKEGESMSEDFSSNSFAYKIRTQFSFFVDDPTLSCILNSIANQNISITGYFQTKILKKNNNYDNNLKSNFVRLVVGSPDEETSKDLMGVRDVLNSLDIKFEEKSVIQVIQIVSGIPGIINGLFGELWCKVTVNALYLGEETRLFIDVSDTCKALLILSEASSEQCPRQCQPCS